MSLFTKVYHKGLFWRAELWDKSWSEEMQTNTVKLIVVKHFLFKNSLNIWMEKIYGKSGTVTKSS